MPIDRPIKSVLWLAFVSVCIGLYVQVPRIIAVNAEMDEREYVAAEKASIAAWSRKETAQTRRAVESIEVVDSGTKLGGGWR